MQENAAARLRDTRSRAAERGPLGNGHYYFLGQDIGLKLLSKQMPNSLPD